MILRKLSDLKNVGAYEPKKKLVLAAAQDDSALIATLRAWKDEIIDPYLSATKKR